MRRLVAVTWSLIKRRYPWIWKSPGREGGVPARSCLLRVISVISNSASGIKTRDSVLNEARTLFFLISVPQWSKSRFVENLRKSLEFAVEMQTCEDTALPYRHRKMSLDPHSFSILIIDDEKVARLALTRMLLKSGYTGEYSFRF